MKRKFIPEQRTLKRERSVAEKRIERLKRLLEKLRVEKRTLREKINDLQKEHRQAVRGLKEGWRLLEALPGGVVLIQDGKIGYINAAAREALGCEEEDVKGHDFADFVHPKFQARLRERYRKRVSGKPVPDRYEACMTSKRGDQLWCEVRVKRILVGGRRAFLFNLIGLNERKRAEKLHIESAKQQVVERFSSGLYREIEGRRGTVDHFSPLLQELQWLGQNGGIKEKAVLFDLRKVAQEVIFAAKRKWGKSPSGKKGAIRIGSYLRALPSLRGRPEEMRYALGALVENAVEALEGEGSVFLTTEESEGFAHLYIQDSGSGIPPEAVDRIYDPFFTSKGKERRGLGLSLARAIIRRNGGDMELRTNKGGGTICTVHMPIPAKPSRKQETARRIRLKDTPVLIISRQDILRELLCRWFSGRGCRVDATATCGEAFQLISKNRYGLLVIDTEKAEGKNVAAILKKANRAASKIPTVLIKNPAAIRSSKAGEQRVSPFLLSKPLNMERAHSVFMEALRAGDQAS
ncbi:MAG: hypothetical protein DRG82_01685 [Deltaproteobacteria bacterium]|nr:MAG: hypothetical protein DRG82_01685 [Deltaproteobacteria bacterium]